MQQCKNYRKICCPYWGVQSATVLLCVLVFWPRENCAKSADSRYVYATCAECCFIDCQAVGPHLNKGKCWWNSEDLKSSLSAEARAVKCVQLTVKVAAASCHPQKHKDLHRKKQ